MPTIQLKFTAGRYHATPWGLHVNEGQVEWPPCPWRLLRALLATGFNKHHWPQVPEDARSLIDKLAATWPRYKLPAGQIAHTRHYMPYVEGKNQKTTKVIDAFIRLASNHDPLLIHYDVELSESERQLLEQLVSDLGYLGRAESWVSGTLIEDTPSDPTWCEPSDDAPSSPIDFGKQQVSILGPVPAHDYATWRQSVIEQHVQQALLELQQTAEKKGKKPSKSQIAKATKKIEAIYPIDLLTCLLSDTSDFQDHGWSQPPGTQYKLYTQPPGTLERKPSRPSSPIREAAHVEAALINLASDTSHANTGLPSFIRCLPQADLLHKAVISQLSQSFCPALTGMDEQKKPLQTNHKHAHYLPLDLDEDGRLDHIIIYAPMKLDSLAQQAIMRQRWTYTKNQTNPLATTCVGFGALDDFRRQLKQRNGKRVPILEQSRTWVSLTPFIPARFVKKDGKNSLENQIRTELETRQTSDGQPFPTPTTIQKIDNDELVERRLLRFIRTRPDDKQQPPVNMAFGIRLTFDQPVTGPITLGYASHYGLGLFVPDTSLNHESTTPAT